MSDQKFAERRDLSSRRAEGLNVGRVVLITGGTSGIGRAMAEAFMREGAVVAVCGRSEVALERFRRSYPDALGIRADVTIADDRGALLDTVTEWFGRLDVLVNNAGSFVERDFSTDADVSEDLEYEVALNLTAPIQLTGEALRRWPEIEAIAFVTSGFALISPTRAPTYGAVKAGLHGFAEGLRRQLASRGIHVLEVVPPSTDTPMSAGATGRKLPPDKVAAVALRALARRRPLALPGQASVLPALLRLAPTLVERKVAAL